MGGAAFFLLHSSNVVPFNMHAEVCLNEDKALGDFVLVGEVEQTHGPRLRAVHGLEDFSLSIVLYDSFIVFS